MATVFAFYIHPTSLSTTVCIAGFRPTETLTHLPLDKMAAVSYVWKVCKPQIGGNVLNVNWPDWTTECNTMSMIRECVLWSAKYPLYWNVIDSHRSLFAISNRIWSTVQSKYNTSQELSIRPVLCCVLLCIPTKLLSVSLWGGGY